MILFDEVRQKMTAHTTFSLETRVIAGDCRVWTTRFLCQGAEADRGEDQRSVAARQESSQVILLAKAPKRHRDPVVVKSFWKKIARLDVFGLGARAQDARQVDAVKVRAVTDEKVAKFPSKVYLFRMRVLRAIFIACSRANREGGQNGRYTYRRTYENFAIDILKVWCDSKVWRLRNFKKKDMQHSILGQLYEARFQKWQTM